MKRQFIVKVRVPYGKELFELCVPGDTSLLRLDEVIRQEGRKLDNDPYDFYDDSHLSKFCFGARRHWKEFLDEKTLYEETSHPVESVWDFSGPASLAKTLMYLWSVGLHRMEYHFDFGAGHCFFVTFWPKNLTRRLGEGNEKDD